MILTNEIVTQFPKLKHLTALESLYLKHIKP